MVGISVTGYTSMPVDCLHEEITEPIRLKPLIHSEKQQVNILVNESSNYSLNQFVSLKG